MLAKLQKLTTLFLLAAAFGWLLYFHRRDPVLAVAGFLVITLGYTVFLAIEFLLLRVVNQSDPAPRPNWQELFSAWIGESWTTPQVFCWRQPFRANAIPDHLAPQPLVQGQRGVVFVHGLFCNRGFWTPWLKRLQGGRHAFIAVNLEPLFGSIDNYALQIDDAVQQITHATGRAPLLVCHSMGGLAARAWLQRMRAEARVHHVVTIGTPHRGTWLARFGHGHNSRQMRRLSDWQAKLDHEMPVDRHSLFTCWYSNCDNIVFPTSTATLPGADNRLVRGAAHVQLAFLPKVMNATLALLGDTYPERLPAGRSQNGLE
ncbi:MAG: permease [Burkholderiales bacterium RIFCSPHIGHO2_12_FULL_61_11]|nr:MAG: permease [Burkholderiales bacterium RIFCSPHIGHO2_12_FULL_61_11]